jgi:hypothetical protein
MNRRHLAALLIVAALLVAVIPLQSIVCNLSDVDSSSDGVPTLYVRQDSGRNESRPRYVYDEVIIRFRKEAAEGEIVGLRIGQGAEEVYVSPFTYARRARS